MEKRKIINIDEDKCNGCGLCADACHEGAIIMQDGKAKLSRDDYCDGLGDCLPVCPTGAISFVMREALAFDKEAVKKNMQVKKAKESGNAPSACAGSGAKTFGGCPGSRAGTFNRQTPAAAAAPAGETQSSLRQWPVQIKLVPENAPYFDGAHLLIAADCAAYSYAAFHRDFMRDKITVIGCPKLDFTDYSEKLTRIIANNDIQSVTIVRMQVPCCSGLENAAKTALKQSGKFIPWQIHTISADGRLI